MKRIYQITAGNGQDFYETNARDAVSLGKEFAETFGKDTVFIDYVEIESKILNESDLSLKELYQDISEDSKKINAYKSF